MTTHRVKQTRQLIQNAVGRIRHQFIPETVTLETDITSEATLYVDLVAQCGGGYAELEITGVDVLKDTSRRTCSLVNIANQIGDELDEAIRVFNRESLEDFKDWCYVQQTLSLSA